ncbi:uncharacterized protein [Branchiostoma lanceolatum]|uniref:uncharacterized protein n=1 Tax=Branchiostoma lanceolatum TaxID=7740 RepID=UPI0034534251
MPAVRNTLAASITEGDLPGSAVYPEFSGFSIAAPVSPAPVDLAFVIDGSSTLGQDGFQQTKLLMTKIVQELNIGTAGSRVTVVQYCHNGWQEFGLDTYTSSRTLQQAINNLEFMDGGSNLADGLNVLYKFGFIRRNGGRPGIKKGAIVIAEEGAARDPAGAARAAAQLHLSGLTVMAVGVGPGAAGLSMKISSDPQFAFSVRTASELFLLRNGLADMLWEAGLNERLYGSFKPRPGIPFNDTTATAFLHPESAEYASVLEKEAVVHAKLQPLAGKLVVNTIGFGAKRGELRINFQVDLSVSVNITAVKEALNDLSGLELVGFQYPLWLTNSGWTISASHNVNNTALTVDGDPATVWSPGDDAINDTWYLTYDLQNVHTLTKLELVSSEVKLFKLQVSRGVSPGGVWRWRDVKTFAARQGVGTNQFSGFRMRSRYWRLQILSTYGGLSPVVGEVNFFGQAAVDTTYLTVETLDTFMPSMNNVASEEFVNFKLVPEWAATFLAEDITRVYSMVVYDVRNSYGNTAIVMQILADTTAIPALQASLEDFYSFNDTFNIPIFNPVVLTMLPGYQFTADVPVFSRSMDVALLLDGATATTQASFDASKTLVKKVAGSLDIPNAARLSVYQFGSTAWQELGYRFYRNYREVGEAMDMLQQKNGDRNTGAALQSVYQTAFNDPQRAGVQKVAMVVTSGASDDNTLYALTAMRSAGIIVYGLGVGYEFGNAGSTASGFSHTFSSSGFISNPGRLYHLGNMLPEMVNNVGSTTHVSFSLSGDYGPSLRNPASVSYSGVVQSLDAGVGPLLRSITGLQTSTLSDIQPWTEGSVLAVFALTVADSSEVNLEDSFTTGGGSVGSQDNFTAPSNPDYRGTEFIVGFPENNGPDDANPQLFVVGMTKTTNVTVQSRSADFYQRVTVEAGTVQAIAIPKRYEIQGYALDAFGLKVTSDEEIALYGLYSKTSAADGFLAYPLDTLGTEYYAVCLPPSASEPSLITVIGTVDGTAVYVTVSAPATFTGIMYQPGQIIRFFLNAQQTAQIQSSGDLTGSYITADSDIVVYSGNKFTQIAGAADDGGYLIQQIPPVETWGREFVTVPIAGRTVGDIYRFVAASDNTVVTISGQDYNLNRGEFYDYLPTTEEFQYINSSAPVMAVLFGDPGHNEYAASGPFMMVVAPLEQTASDYTFTAAAFNTTSSATYMASIAVKDSERLGMYVDGNNIGSLPGWQSVQGRDLAAVSFEITPGPHRVRHLSPNVHFAVYVTGFTDMESYGYPAGMLLADLSACTNTTPAINDGVDNDCDGRTDEEIPNGLDDDQDGMVDEDTSVYLCSPNPCENGGVCTESVDQRSPECDCRPGFVGTFCHVQLALQSVEGPTWLNTSGWVVVSSVGGEANLTIDGNNASYWEPDPVQLMSARATGSFYLELDLEEHYQLDRLSLTIPALSGGSTDISFQLWMLQYGMAGADGVVWRDARTFFLSREQSSWTWEFRGFRATGRYWRLVMPLDRQSGSLAAIAEVQLRGQVVVAQQTSMLELPRSLVPRLHDISPMQFINVKTMVETNLMELFGTDAGLCCQIYSIQVFKANVRYANAVNVQIRLTYRATMTNFLTVSSQLQTAASTGAVGSLTVTGYQASMPGQNINLVSTPLDLVFMLDGSDSVTPQSFWRAKAFLRSVIGEFRLGPQYTQVSVFQYGGEVRQEFTLSSYQDHRALAAGLAAITQLSGPRRTGAALQYAVRNGFSAPNGGGRNVGKVLVLLSTGVSADSVQQAANDAARAGIVVYAIGVGVGPSINMYQLQGIALSASTVYTVNNFYSLAGFRDELSRRFYAGRSFTFMRGVF